MADDEVPAQDKRPTVELDPQSLGASWPLALAMLEQLAPWTVLALRLGTLALAQECIRSMTSPGAPAALVVELESLVHALRHMPWEQ